MTSVRIAELIYSDDFFNLGNLLFENPLDAHPERHSGHRSTGAVAGQSYANRAILDFHQFDITAVCLQGRPYLV